MSKPMESLIPKSMIASIHHALSTHWQILLSTCSIEHLTQDSRQVQPESLFFAMPSRVPNSDSDGRDFIRSALSQGAVCILAEAESVAPHEAARWLVALDETEKNQVIWVSQLWRWMPHILSSFYEIRWDDIRLLGVTGTNGKTSCTYFLAQLLERHGCGLMGTLGLGHWRQLESSINTTSDMISAHAAIAKMQQARMGYVAMEVSSHALDQDRIEGLVFDTAVFTNLSRDHLDYHHTLTEYGQAKEKLFLRPELKRAIFNIKDPYVAEVCQKLSKDKARVLEIWGYGCQLEPLDYLPEDRQVWLRTPIEHQAEGMRLNLSLGGRSLMLQVPLVGVFNAENILAVICVLAALGEAPESWLKKIAALEAPPGRMQVMRREGFAKVVVDYAHTPEALKLALESIKLSCQGKLWCVFGCGGARDESKRGIMGQLAVDIADQLVLTADNSRSEPTSKIISDICEPLSASERATIRVEFDRWAAIRLALSESMPEDWVLVAGKGHERTQDIDGNQQVFHDPTVVEACFDELSLN